MDGDDTDISPTMQTLLDQIPHERAKTEITQCLIDLKHAFKTISNRLDLEILTLKDDDHPDALLDYSNDHFNLEPMIRPFVSDNEPFNPKPEPYIRQCCKVLDHQTLQCFDTIKTFLDTDVYHPLNEKLNHLEQAVIQWNQAFETIPDRKDQLLARADDASEEFKKNIAAYKTWFAFYQTSSIRDFTLIEIITAAETIVWDINSVMIQEKKIGHAEIQAAEAIQSLYFKGQDFHDMLEIFKILFQNVVFHARTKDHTCGIMIHMYPIQISW